MPTISMFLGILIKMNWMDAGKHNQPHFHAYYGDFEARFPSMAKFSRANFRENRRLL